MRGVLTFLVFLTVPVAVAAVVAQAQAPQVTFEVTVPPETPANAEVWLSGNHAALGVASSTRAELRGAVALGAVVDDCGGGARLAATTDSSSVHPPS